MLSSRSAMGCRGRAPRAKARAIFCGATQLLGGVFRIGIRVPWGLIRVSGLGSRVRGFRVSDQTQIYPKLQRSPEVAGLANRRAVVVRLAAVLGAALVLFGMRPEP